MTRVALLAALCAAPFAPQQQPPRPVPPAAPAAAPQAVLEAQERAALARHAAIVAFGQEERFRAELARLCAELPEDADALPFVPLKEGCLPPRILRNFAQWHAPVRPGRPVAALDVELEHHPLAAIVDFAEQLRVRGIDLLVVLLPTRIEVHPEHVVDLDLAGFPGFGSATQQFVAELAARGVAAESLLDEFVAGRRADAPLYLTTDPHLTPRGYELAARVAARRLKELPGHVPGKLVAGRDFTIVQEDFKYAPEPTIAKRGAQPAVVNGATLKSGRNYFDWVDPQAPIVVLGDSNARIYSIGGCDFVAQLGRFTAQRLDFIKADDGSQEAVRKKLALRDAERWKSMKQVVWLLSEAVLIPSPRWKRVALPE
ncbi:MAG: hypothetical protein JNL90_09645 [Planctomycetes bacterium]|nr:hypothetical protein [Planctomycetota bacterium]